MRQLTVDFNRVIEENHSTLARRLIQRNREPSSHAAPQNAGYVSGCMSSIRFPNGSWT